ncbi:MAG: hypothetical protein ABI140_19365, partial [Jatrophihabitantaceae bacterium]
MTSPEPGPLAEEFAKLVGAAQDWFNRLAADPASARIATGSPDCCWCPICQLIATLRGERPELMQRLGELQAVLAGLWQAAASHGSADGEPASAGPADQAPPRVHRIRLDGADPGPPDYGAPGAEPPDPEPPDPELPDP